MLTFCICQLLGAAHVIFATDVLIATNALMTTWAFLEEAVSPAIDAGNLTAVQEALLLSPAARNVQIVLANIHLDWQANVGNVLTWANGNVTQLNDLLTGEVFSSLSQLFADYHFEPTVSGSLPAFLSDTQQCRASLKSLVIYRKKRTISSPRH